MIALMPQEFELKSVVDDVEAVRGRLEARGARLVFDGRLEDRRWDHPDGALLSRDEVLRVRTYRDAQGAHARCSLDFKGPTRVEAGYKVREEFSTEATSPDALATILQRLGLVPSLAVDRRITQFELGGAVIRL